MKQLKSLMEIIRKLNYMLTKGQMRTGVIIMLMIAFGSFVDMLGVSAILPFIEAILTPDEIAKKWYVKPIIQVFHPSSMEKLTIIIGIGIIFIYIFNNVSN